jgi:hypothetical protein
VKIPPNTYHLQAKESILLNVPAENKVQHPSCWIKRFKKNHIPYLATEFCSTVGTTGIKPLNAGEESQGCQLKGFEICRNFPISYILTFIPCIFSYTSIYAIS